MHLGTTRPASSTSSAAKTVNGLVGWTLFQTTYKYERRCPNLDTICQPLLDANFERMSIDLPRLQYITVTWLIRQAVPVLLQPPLLTTSRKTECAEFLGQRTQSGIRTTRKPRRCPKREMISSIGRIFAPHVLKNMVTTRNASIIKVYCQFGNPKLALVTSIMASICVVTTNTLLATLASQPSVDIQPTVCEIVRLGRIETRPTGCVAEELLVFRGSEFANPMVLPSTSWCPEEPCVRREAV
jgi:hypothetical protein